MDAIKKKMQAMKLEKDNAMDKADTCEGQAKEANMRADKVLEEVGDLVKKLQQVEADLVANKGNLEQANKNLEEREKSLTNVSIVAFLLMSIEILIFGQLLEFLFCCPGWIWGGCIEQKSPAYWRGFGTFGRTFEHR